MTMSESYGQGNGEESFTMLYHVIELDVDRRFTQGCTYAGDWLTKSDFQQIIPLYPVLPFSILIVQMAIHE
jgi:hypothetical protein